MKGVYFNNIHSYNDLSLILAPFTPAPAKPKTKYVEVEGADGSIDLTEAQGETKFFDRDLSFLFSVSTKNEKTFDEKFTEVSNALNGLKCKITLDRDPDYYFDGRLTVDEYMQDRRLCQITVTAKVRPYKFKQEKTVVETELSATEKTLYLVNGRKSAVPIITVSENAVIVFGGKTFTISESGDYEILDIYLKQGENKITVSGSGTIKFTWQEGEL